MALKTTETKASVTEFIKSIEDDTQRADAKKLVKLMREASGCRAKLWGTSIVGFGRYQYKYESGREGEWFQVGFSPRKRDMTLYIMPGFSSYGKLLRRLGKHKTGKSCLYIKRLDEVDVEVLRELVVASVEEIKQRYA